MLRLDLPHLTHPLLGDADHLRVHAHPPLPGPRHACHTQGEQAEGEAGQPRGQWHTQAPQVHQREGQGEAQGQPPGQLPRPAGRQDPHRSRLHRGPVLPVRLRHGPHVPLLQEALPLHRGVLHVPAHREDHLHHLHAGGGLRVPAAQRGGGVLPATEQDPVFLQEALAHDDVRSAPGSALSPHVAHGGGRPAAEQDEHGL